MSKTKPKTKAGTVSGKKRRFSVKAAIITILTAGIVVGAAIAAVVLLTEPEEVIETMAAQWPSSFLIGSEADNYVEPEFVDDENRENNAFNVADFGEQGSNGWFYRYGSSDSPTKSRRLELFVDDGYHQSGIDGLEIKSDFIHTGAGVSPILEWRVARTGSVNMKLTYVKNVNGDQNPAWPDGVTIRIYKGAELLESYPVEIQVDKETLLETEIEDMEVEEDESLYVVVDPGDNNAYDGGLLYVVISDVNAEPPVAETDSSRTDNNANNIEDFGSQGKNGWYYMFGKDVKSSELVSTETEDGYINSTSPALVIKKDFIHPAINDNAILCWAPAKDGLIEVRGKYTKFEQNDGNPDWPDGVIVQVYLNEQKLFEKDVAAPAEGTEAIDFREAKINVTTEDRLYFVVNANQNSSYDGGCFDITIMDRDGRITEDDITVDESETRQNIANVKDDFGQQGDNGWFYQEGYQDEPFGAYNIEQYIEGDKYVDDHYLEIKRDYVNVGENGRSAVIKWKVAQDGNIKIDASYTKLKNEDANPDWPDGTRVTIYHNNSALVSQEFAPEVSEEVTKSLNVERLSVKKGDYITMVVNGKDNNAYDGGNYSFSITSVSGLVGASENDETIENDKDRTNNANVLNDFGKQGTNGWFYQYGYNLDPFCAVNIESYEEGEKYYTNDGIEIKRDYIMPATKGKSANVKWKVAQDGKINIFVSYTKLKNEDANPDWPDGTIVTLMHNDTVLKSEYFAPEVFKEITKDLNVLSLNVKKGDYITLLVHGKDNTAYDGGLYSFEIEDATIVTLNKKNDSKENRANLALDFGEQGSNGWYYLEGRTPESASILTKKTDDNAGYTSVSDSELQVKKDFVQPGLKKAAMYQWVVAQNGEIEVIGKYVKFGHEDGNPDWPDGTRVRVYLNNTLLLERSAAVLQGEGNSNTIIIDLGKQKVKKGDILTFAIDAVNNNAWDGGKLAMEIRPYEGNITYKPAPDNDASLFADFGEQGNQGWYYGYGNSSKEFKTADYNNGEYRFILQDELLLKKDGVHPGESAGAIYRWVAGADGTVNLEGTYYKSRNEDEKDNTPDGVKVEVYQNGKLIRGMSYDVAVSKDREIVQPIEKLNLNVKKGDQIDFIIKAKKNIAWDYGKLEMEISEVRKPDYSSVANGRENDTDLAESFGEQGSDGWFYLEGGSLEAASLLVEKTDDGFGYKSKTDSDLQVKKDFVQPGSSKDAMYQWVVAQNGEVDITGSYVKFGQEDANPDWPDGTKISIYLNSKLLFSKNVEVFRGDGNDNTIKIDLKAQSVKKGDVLTFVVNARSNNAYDGGRLSIRVKTHTEEPEYKPGESNNANLYSDFGAQGNNGWYYGACEWNGEEFELLEYDAEKQGYYYNNGKPELKKDYVEPGNGKNAAYKWIAAEDGTIHITGEYVKFANAADPYANGVCLRIFQNLVEKKWIGDGINVGNITEEVTISIDETLEVKRGDEIMFAVNPEGNDSYDGGRLTINIAPAGSDHPSEPDDPTEPDDGRTNNTSLFEDFSGIQGKNGWYYGVCDWDGKNFRQLAYDDENERYYNNGKPELKKDYVEPGNGNAAYKWVAAEDGTIRITGEYVKFANVADPNADGVCLRIFQNLVEKKWIGDGIMGGNITEEVTVSIDETLEVKKGDEIIFAVSPESNDSYDGGRLSITISAVE